MFNFLSGFKYRMEASADVVLEAVIFLTRSIELPSGSSFAVTSDARPGNRILHLTASSYSRLLKKGLVSELIPSLEDSEEL